MSFCTNLKKIKKFLYNECIHMITSDWKLITEACYRMYCMLGLGTKTYTFDFFTHFKKCTLKGNIRLWAYILTISIVTHFQESVWASNHGLTYNTYIDTHLYFTVITCIVKDNDACDSLCNRCLIIHRRIRKLYLYYILFIRLLVSKYM